MRCTSQNFYNLICFTLALLFLGTFYPFVHNYVIFGNTKAYVTLVALTVWTFITLYKTRFIICLPDRSFNIIIFVQATFFLVWSFIFSSKGIMRYGINTLIGWYTLTLILNSINIDYFFKTFIKLNFLSLILSIIGIILVVNGITGLFSIHDYQGDREIYNYLFFFIKREEITFLNYRIAGYYDEPGSFAFIIMLLLLINRKYYKNMKWEYTLLILPFITTSMAHIVTVIIFISLYYFGKKYIKFLPIVAMFILLIYILVINIESNAYVAFFKKQTVERFESLASGEADEGRGGGFKLGGQIFKENPFAISPENIKKQYPTYVHEVFWSPLLYFGLIGLPLYLLLFIYILIKNINDKYVIYALILFTVNLLQRPNYTYPIYIVLLYFIFFNQKLNGTEAIRNYKIMLPGPKRGKLSVLLGHKAD